MSTGLGDDESHAYHRFWRMARMLGTISGSMNTLALGATTAYFAALTQPAAVAWTTLIEQTALLVNGASALDGIVKFDTKEREALAFFEAIVNENADLLVPAATAPVTTYVQELGSIYSVVPARERGPALAQFLN